MILISAWTPLLGVVMCVAPVKDGLGQGTSSEVAPSQQPDCQLPRKGLEGTALKSAVTASQ